MAGRPSGPIVRSLPTPFSGLVQSVPAHQAPNTSGTIVKNCYFSMGSLRTRPGFTKASNSPGLPSDPAFLEMPVGIGWANTINGNFDVYVCGTTNLWRLRGGTGSWTDISGAVTLTVTATDRARWTALYNKATDQTAFMFATGTDPLVRSLDGGNFAAVTGVDNGQDICTVAARAMQAFLPNRIQWSDIYGSGTWPSLNFYYAADTPGKIVALRPLGTLGVAIYKEDSIIVGYSQPGSPAAAFRFETRVQRPGPASKNAVVDAEGMHYYMTPRGRIAAFDGTNFAWIGDGFWPFMFDPTDGFDFFNAYQTTGFYDPSRGIVVFIYPRISENGDGPTGIAIVTLPHPEWGVTSYGVWPGILSWPVASATHVFYASGQFGLVCRKLTPYMVDYFDYTSLTDEGTAFPCRFVSSLQSMPEVNKVDIEAFLRRSSGYGTATMSAVTSYVLGAYPGTSSAAQTIDLENTGLVRDPKGYNASGRFVGLDLNWTSDTGTVIYDGALVTGYAVEGG